MPRKKILQSNFSAGELADDLGMRQDTDQYQNGAKSLLNRRCLIGGGTKRRPGSWIEAFLPSRSRIDSWIINRDTNYVIAFVQEGFRAYQRDPDTGDLTAAGSINNCPWTGTRWLEMDFVQSGDTMFVTHTGFWPQVITRTSVNTWTIADFAFYIGSSSRPEQPYIKFAAQAWTLAPSALTGSITLTLGGGATAYFEADHVGTYIRYVGKACLITAVAVNGLSCTATVIETLPTTQTLNVTSTAQFAVGEAVEGSVTGAKGVVTAVTDATHLDVVITEGLIEFAATDDPIVGPNGKTNTTGVATASAFAGVTDWEEQMFSDVHGYPACIELHRNRLLFAGHAEVPEYLISSTLNNLYNFNVGDASDGDGFIESIGDDAASRIVKLHSAEQLLVGTDRGPYYVPETSAAPFRPSSIAFFPFGSPWPITESVRFASFDNGVMFLSGSTVIKASPTGDLNRAWEANEVSLLAHHLVSNPTDLAVVSNFADGPERYGVMPNDDGTLAVMQLVEKQNIRNFTPWDTEGTYDFVAAIEQHLYASVRRTIAGTTVYLLERFDQDITLDAAMEYATLDTATIQSTYGATTVNVVAGTSHLGTYPLSITNPPDGPYIVGIYYDTELEILPPVIQGPEGDMAGDVMRILEAYVHVIGSQRFATNGYTLSAYQVTDPVDESPPDKTGPQKFNFLGWEREPTITITQPDPLALDILAVRTTVAY